MLNYKSRSIMKNKEKRMADYYLWNICVNKLTVPVFKASQFTTLSQSVWPLSAFNPGITIGGGKPSASAPGFRFVRVHVRIGHQTQNSQQYLLIGYMILPKWTVSDYIFHSSQWLVVRRHCRSVPLPCSMSSQWLILQWSQILPRTRTFCTCWLLFFYSCNMFVETGSWVRSLKVRCSWVAMRTIF